MVFGATNRVVIWFLQYNKCGAEFRRVNDIKEIAGGCLAVLTTRRLIGDPKIF
jgi:hypothetical protein